MRSVASEEVPERPAQVTVYRLKFDDRDDRADLYIKSVDSPEGATRLGEEAARLAWLRHRLAVPEVVAVARDGDRAWLVTTALPGTCGSEPLHRVDGPGLARAMAAGLRVVHELDVASCPFDARLPVRRAEVDRRLGEGLVDGSTFQEAYRRYHPDHLRDLWVASEPTGDEDLVVTHGRYTLDNLLLERGAVAGYTGWARCGVADRYVDLALAARSLATALGPELVVSFFDAYGLEHPALAKIDFYVLADEFC